MLKTLRGEPGANSVIHLQTNFGGGKTHAELALYHLLNSPQAALAAPGVAAFLAEIGVEDIPEAAVAALPCADLYAGGRDVAGGLTLHTLWGELAYRLGGAPLYGVVRQSDEERCAPGVELLRELLIQAGPNLILIDELLHYVDKAASIPVGDSNLASQTIGFLRELTEAVDAVAHSVLVASLTASRMEDLTVLVGDEAEFTLAKLEDTLRRVEDSRTPIEGSEIYDVVRARLFERVDEETAVAVAAAYSQFYRGDPWRDLLPQESRDAGYEELLRKAYPFHPSIVKVLYERWGSRPQFQLTRGTLRFLSHLLARLWSSQPSQGGAGGGPLIHLSDVDLADEDVRGEALRVAGSAWEAIIGGDIAALGQDATAIAQRLDRTRGGLYTRHGLVQGVATSVFMFTHGGQQGKATPQAEVRLAVAQPAIPLSDLHQAFDDCKANLYYYYEEDGGSLFKTEPNPNKVLSDERANVTTDDARRQVERVVAEVVGRSNLFHLNFYGFADSPVREPGDVPDDSHLQLVILPPRLTVVRGKLVGKAGEVVPDVTENYGKKHRMNRNLVLFMAPDGEYISGAVERAMDWLAALAVAGDRGLMSRFAEPQQAMIRDKVTTAANDTQDHVRKAYNSVILPAGVGKYEPFELSYVPPSKTVLEQAEGELLVQGKLHREFNPALLEGRWASLWPRTATVMTTEALWEKFARQGDAPILTGIEVLQAMIRAGVEREVFGYGVLRETEADKLKPASYERVYLGPADGRELDVAEISGRAILMRPDQLYALFPPLTAQEVAMLLTALRQTVEAAFRAARTSPAVRGRVDERSFIAAVCAGVKVGLFGYTETAGAPVLRGPDVELTSESVRFYALLIAEETPQPVTADEVARLVPATGKLAVQDLYQKAVTTYGAERVGEGGLLNALQKCIADGRFGYGASEAATFQTGIQAVSLAGYIGQPEALPPDTRVIRLAGPVSAVELASVIKTATNLSKLGQSALTLELRLELKGDVNDHAVLMALNELRGRVAGLKVEDVKGKG